MTVSNAVAIFGILISATVALLIAYMHRRQMRQVELFKQDPSVGLSPPPSRITRFITSKWDTILGFAGPVYVLVTQFFSAGPVTRLTIFAVSGAFALMFANFVMMLVFKLQERNTERIKEVLALHNASVVGTNKILDLVEKLRT